MCSSFAVDLLSIASIALLVFVPAAVINRREDRSTQNRSRDEVLRRTILEVDEIFALYEKAFDRDRSIGVGCCYARYSTSKQDSIGAQIQKILQHAIKLGIHVPRQYIFFDIAVSGKKGHRNELSKLQDTLRDKKCNTLVLFATNRMFRKTWRTLEFADRVHKNWGVRIIFIAQGIDTNDKKWELTLHTHALIDQFVVTMYSDNIRAAHEGLFERRCVFGSISFGYRGDVIAGEFSRTGKPRRRLVIDEETATVVRQIFDLFVNKRVGLKEIARILNDDMATPRPPRCRSGLWSDDTVRRILTNQRYRGYWQYGVTESVYLSDPDYVRKFTRAEPLKAAQIEELRIIDDALWFEAARLIAGNGQCHGGRQSKDGDVTSRPDTLNGLLHCDAHDRPLVVSGAYGRHMVCPECQCLPRKKRALTTWLNRAVTLRQFCEEIARRLVGDSELVEQVIHACRQAADAHDRPNPAEENRLKTNLKKSKNAIDFTLRHPGDTPEDQANSTRLVREFRRESTELEARLRTLQALRATKRQVPSEKEVLGMLKKLAKHLQNAAHSADLAERAIVRQLVEELTGGRIVISQQGERMRQRGWLRGRFRLWLLSAVTKRISGAPIACDDDGVEASIDFKRPLSIDTQCEIAWQMHNEKKRYAEVAEFLGCSQSYVTKLLKYHAKKHDYTYTDGRSLRTDFPHLNRKPALYKRIVEQVMKLYFEDVPLGEIAVVCKVHVVTIRNTIRWYHEGRGLKVPNGRTRAGRIRRGRNLENDVS